MISSAPLRRLRWTWRVFDPRDQRCIERQLRDHPAPCCPCCGDCLEARPGTRLTRALPLDATGYDLDCRDCRRFVCIIHHTPRSLRLMRMRRLAAAVGAMGARPVVAADPLSAV